MDIVETLIIIGVLSLIGFVNEKTKPREYHYENRIVTVYKKYQCPKYCKVDHYHYVYYYSTLGGMFVDKSKIGKRFYSPQKIN